MILRAPRATGKNTVRLPPNVTRRALTVDGPAGNLEARVNGPDDGRPVLACHPHPQGEGTMGSRLVYDVAKGVGEAGFCAYRFNYRGVGRSTGSYAKGIGETEDAVAVYDAIVARHGSCGTVIGHSFGGAVAIRLATRRKLETLVVIATPPQVSMSDLVPIDDARHAIAHAHVIVGTDDAYVPVAHAQDLASAFPEPAELTVLDGGDHFLTPEHTPRVLTEVLRILRE